MFNQLVRKPSGKAARITPIAFLLATTLVLSGCQSTASTPDPLPGTWSGTINDSAYGQGTLSVSLNDLNAACNQVDCDQLTQDFVDAGIDTGGLWTATFPAAVESGAAAERSASSRFGAYGRAPPAIGPYSRARSPKGKK